MINQNLIPLAEKRNMNNLQVSIIYSSIIGSLLSEFEQSKKPIEDMKRQVKKFMFKRSRTNKKEFQEAVKQGNKIWVNTIAHFEEAKLSIDVFSTVIALWSSQADLLARFVNLNENRIERFSMLNDNDRLDAEMDAYKVAEYLNNEIKAMRW